MSDASLASTKANPANMPGASPGITLLEKLAQHVLAFDKRQLTKASIAQARACILDAIGVTLAGYPEPCTQILLSTPGVATAPGSSLIFGSARRTSMLDAALINGTASHALDFDDCNNTFGGHPSAPIVPALFALGEEHGANGRDFIAAYVAGFETECKIALGVNFYHY
ncbi:MAG: MmgE/PrpD family protein, partial [Bradyrhizobium sp.]